MNWERLFQGEALVPPSTDRWDCNDTANSGALFLPRGPETDEVLTNIIGAERLAEPDLCDGAVVLLHNGVERSEQGSCCRKGLCIFTPELGLVYKHPVPVLEPTPGTIDSAGVEDARLTFEDGWFFAWYCGYNGQNGRACAARSRDLLHWEKSAPMPGTINAGDNKDHVIFPDTVNGVYYMLHRPWGGEEFAREYRMPIRLARAGSPLGPWDDLGILLEPERVEGHAHDWLGGGAQPLALGEGRFLLLYHTGCYFPDEYRCYEAAAAIVDFSRLEQSDPRSMVTHRLEPIMRPSAEYPNEINSELRLDIVFPMGAYRYGEYICMVYGAGDKVTCGARIPFAELLAEVERHPVQP